MVRQRKMRCKRSLIGPMLAVLGGVAFSSAIAQTPVALTGDAVLDHLNAVIDWYRHATTRVQTVGLPSDAIYQYNTQSMAAEVAKLAFQSAQAVGPLLPASGPGGGCERYQRAGEGQAAKRCDGSHHRPRCPDQQP